MSDYTSESTNQKKVESKDIYCYEYISDDDDIESPASPIEILYYEWSNSD